MGKMVIPSKLTELPKVQQTILDQAQAQGFGKDELFAIRLALDEAVSNAIQHGNQGDPSKQVTIRFDFKQDDLVIDIADEGPGYDPDSIPDPTLEENLCTPSGRGIMLIRAYMSEVRFNKTCNHITMVKRKGCKLPAKN